MAKLIVVIAPYAPEGKPTRPAASPDSSFYSTTTYPSSTGGSDAPEEANLTYKQRPKYVRLSTLISITDDKGAVMNSSPKPQPLNWTSTEANLQRLSVKSGLYACGHGHRPGPRQLTGKSLVHLVGHADCRRIGPCPPVASRRMVTPEGKQANIWASGLPFFPTRCREDLGAV
ncbi:hypothetical protein T265_02077 [Opisthorchis viverrini]|uniref:Uncharacterized protein n=1 Tax=Opisthorchis viverrini TaxID=6198 RepID=A0A074ZXA6_OPIVI|nr:hypothetical protein T265_02077 [Opisthorchis viverrini]KER31706.1 hypothetical protein T265_02077 [Opisthorchis viverrini]